MAHTLELPEPVYEALVQVAQSNGQTPVEWLTQWLPKPHSVVTEEERRAANERIRQCIISSGRASGADNASIDADLAKAYADPHNPTPSD
jgi:hypothetical protein